MSLAEALAEKTTGKNAIELTLDIFQNLFFCQYIKDSRVVLVHKTSYGFWRYIDENRKEKQFCNPGDLIVFDNGLIRFMQLEEFEKYEYGQIVLPEIQKAIFY